MCVGTLPARIFTVIRNGRKPFCQSGSRQFDVLSQGTRKRDLTIKRQLFDREGVREYWIVDPDRNKVAVYRRRDDGSFPLAMTIGARDADTLTTPLLPGWQLSLERLFRA